MSFQTSQQELFSQHLPYEVDMLNGTFRQLDAAANQFQANVLIESFCIHARNLIEFFQKRPKKGRNVARDFVSGELHVFAGKEPRIEELMEKLNNQIAHLIFLKRTAENADKIGPADRLEIMLLLSFAITKFKESLKAEFLREKIPDVQASPVSVSFSTSSAPNSVLITNTDVRTVGGPTGPKGTRGT